MIVRPGKDEHDDEAIGNECTDDDSVQYFSTCEEANVLLSGHFIPPSHAIHYCVYSWGCRLAFWHSCFERLDKGVGEGGGVDHS